MLIDSAGIAISECPEILFLLIGGRTGQINYYQNLVSERNLRDFFRFTGNVSPAEVIAHLDLASVVVSPRLEGTSIPLKIYTYLLSGKPLVATNIAAHRMVLNEDLAVLAAPNPEEFAQAILKLFNNPQLGLHLAGRAQEFMREKNGFDTYQKRVAFISQTMVTDQSAQVPAKASFENE